jgi:Na+/H+ antiporter NhaC
MDQPDILSLLPIAVTLVVALLSRNVLAGLAVGLFTGVLMISAADPLTAAGLLVTDHLVPQLMDSYNAAVLVLLVFIGGFVALMEHSGGGAAFARDVTRWLTTRARLQLAAWSGGILIFFSDLGTPLIVGPVFRSLADKLGMSRQKLAFIIDSTASPVAILIPFIGWGVYIMSLLQQQFEQLGVGESDFTAFIRAIPFQLYAWLAVLMTPWLAFLKLDYGAMAQAEQTARKPGESVIATPVSTDDDRARAYFIWLPLLVLAAILGWMLVPLGFPFGRVSGGDFRAALSVAYLGAALTLITLLMMTGARNLLSSLALYFEGMSRMMQVAIMLVLAWALSDVGAELGSAEYIAGVAAAGVPGWLIPLMVFAFSAMISFATGSSWGTFAIMFPLALPAALATDAQLFVTIGAVLSGGLFGDHSSPISETTILSATGADCEQYDHFRTQLPYALSNGGLAALGFLLAGITGSVWTLAGLVIAQVLMLLLIRSAATGDRDVLPSPG